MIRLVFQIHDALRRRIDKALHARQLFQPRRSHQLGFIQLERPALMWMNEAPQHIAESPIVDGRSTVKQQQLDDLQLDVQCHSSVKSVSV